MYKKTPNNKDLLDEKNSQELKKIKEKNSNIYSIMEDFYNIIMLEDYSDEYIQKMLNTPSLLNKLTTLWIDDDRFLNLQKAILQEFLKSSNK